MSNRREFLKQLLLGGIGFSSFGLLPNKVFGSKKKDFTKITILHTNDVHSHVEPFSINDPKYPGLGGAARRASIIDDIRNTEKNVLLFDAGDIFQGTPYFNVYKGEIDFKLMSLMQYDASAIGNHDFDNGIDGLYNMLPHAKFPFICSNYDFNNTIMKDKVSKYKTFEKDGIKIGVFGLGVELDGLVDKDLYKDTKYLDPIEISNQMAIDLKDKENCHFIICLSHLGYEYKTDKVSDIVLAKNTSNIDLIIGGHTHTFLDKPIQVKNSSNKKTIITQVGWAGINLGRLEFYFSSDKKYYLFEAHNLNIHNKNF